MQVHGRKTYREIMSQPKVWQEVIKGFAGRQSNPIISKNNFDQVFFTGCGSTYYLSIWAARAVQERYRQFSRPLPASELWVSPENWYVPGTHNLLVAISRSGATTETVSALKYFHAQQLGSSLGITCYPESELADLVTTLVDVPAAKEESIAQTRSFTSMMLGVAHAFSPVQPGGLEHLLEQQAAALIEREITAMTNFGWDQRFERFFFLGSGARYGLACEAMLKMKEMSLSYSEAYHFMEFRHGPMSMVNDHSLVVGLLTRENNQHELDVLKDMKNLGARILSIGDTGRQGAPKWIDHAIPLQLDGLDLFGDVLYLPSLQIMAFEHALSKGLDPDSPNNLDAVVVLKN